MHFDFGSILGVIATVIGTWLGSRIITPKNHERAAALDAIARGAAALVISLAPAGAKWAELLKSVVQIISSAAGRPTTNVNAIERAAAAALISMGRGPGV